MSDVTGLIGAIERGEPEAADRLLPLVYEELRHLAALQLTRESRGHTLQPTALVHEAYMRMVGPCDGERWRSRGHFLAAASLAMRRILVENARRKGASKRGGRWQRLPLEEFHRIEESPDSLLDLDEALTRLAADEPEKARLVQLRFFAGLSMKEAADALGVSVATAERWWSYAKAWLYCELEEVPAKSPEA